MLVRKVAFKDRLNRHLKNSQPGPCKEIAGRSKKIQELFFANCKNQEIADM